MLAEDDNNNNNNDNNNKMIKAIGNYSVIPLALAAILLVISAFALGVNPERSNNAATLGYYLLVIGAVMKFIPYIRRRKRGGGIENDGSA